MRVNTVLKTIFLVTLASFTASALAGGLSIGDAMPMSDVKLKGTSGGSYSLADAAGEKGTLVIFTCTHCPYVKKWESRTVAVANEFASKGVGVVALNSNDPSKYAGDSFEGMQERAASAGMKYPYVVDAGSKLAKAFGAQRTPEFFLFNAEGKLVYHGTIDDSVESAETVEKHYLRDALTALVEGREIPEAKTKALGCSIKFYS